MNTFMNDFSTLNGLIQLITFAINIKLFVSHKYKIKKMKFARKIRKIFKINRRNQTQTQTLNENINDADTETKTIIRYQINRPAILSNITTSIGSKIIENNKIVSSKLREVYNKICERIGQYTLYFLLLMLVLYFIHCTYSHWCYENQSNNGSSFDYTNDTKSSAHHKDTVVNNNYFEEKIKTAIIRGVHYHFTH